MQDGFGSGVHAAAPRRCRNRHFTGSPIDALVHLVVWNELCRHIQAYRPVRPDLRPSPTCASPKSSHSGGPRALGISILRPLWRRQIVNGYYRYCGEAGLRFTQLPALNSLRDNVKPRSTAIFTRFHNAASTPRLPSHHPGKRACTSALP